MATTSSADAPRNKVQQSWVIAVAVIPVIAASVLGQLATYPNLTPWYAGLVKPSFNHRIGFSRPYGPHFTRLWHFQSGGYCGCTEGLHYAGLV